jgi:hypothetical protein
MYKGMIMEQRPLLRTWVLYPLMILIPFVSLSQNAPLTTAATVGNAVPGQVAVPVTVTGFNNIGAVSLSLDYSYSGLHFTMGAPAPQLGNFIFTDHDLGTGYHRITMGWFGQGTSLPDGTAILTLYFTYISGVIPLEWYDIGPSCQYADGNNNILNDIPTSSYYFNGCVCGGIGNPGNIQGVSAVCQGQSGVPYSIAPLANATGYYWGLPPGCSIATGQNTNSITVDFSLSSSSGNVEVYGINPCGNGPSSQLSVIVNPIPVADAGIDQTIPYGTSTILFASNGGTGSFSYHWSPENLLINPNLQNAQTVNLNSTTIFTLDVTNLASQCQNSDQVTVFISGGPLTANPVAIPSATCHGDSSHLYANPGGGSGNYSYSWTSIPPGLPPWSSNLADPAVSPDSSTTYNLVVNDGFNTATGSTFLTIHQLPTAAISGGDTLCGEGNSTPLTVDLTGVPPWSFLYSDGLNTYTVANQLATPYIITATLPGLYTVLFVEDEYCPGVTDGAAAVYKFPVPPAPVIVQTDTDLQSSTCCGNQWYQDGIALQGDTGQIYTPNATDHYYDIVTLYGCTSDTSNDIYFVMTGLPGIRNAHFGVLRNPAFGSVFLISDKGIGNALKVKLLNIIGQEIRSFQIGPFSPGLPARLDVSDVSGGLYFLEIFGNEDLELIKIIIAQ